MVDDFIYRSLSTSTVYLSDPRVLGRGEQLERGEQGKERKKKAANQDNCNTAMLYDDVTKGGVNAARRRTGMIAALNHGTIKIS